MKNTNTTRYTFISAFYPPIRPFVTLSSIRPSVRLLSIRPHPRFILTRLEHLSKSVI